MGKDSELPGALLVELPSDLKSTIRKKGCFVVEGTEFPS